MAKTRLAKLEAAIENLARYPLACSVGPVDGTRLLISQGHKVLYEIEADAAGEAATSDVIILRIYGPGQSTT